MTVHPRMQCGRCGGFVHMTIPEEKEYYRFECECKTVHPSVKFPDAWNPEVPADA